MWCLTLFRLVSAPLRYATHRTSCYATKGTREELTLFRTTALF
jgi:hypothetical protein